MNSDFFSYVYTTTLGNCISYRIYHKDKTPSHAHYGHAASCGLSDETCVHNMGKHVVWHPDPMNYYYWQSSLHDSSIGVLK